MKKGKNSLNHDSNDLIDSADFKNQSNHDNHKNQGSDNMKALDEESADILNSILELI